MHKLIATLALTGTVVFVPNPGPGVAYGPVLIVEVPPSAPVPMPAKAPKKEVKK